MGSGLALAIRQKWPEVYQSYLRFWGRSTPDTLLGQILLVDVSPTLKVCNVFGQLHYGKNPHVCYTDYTAVRKALTALNTQRNNECVYIPLNMGCSLAGGSWLVYSAIIEHCIPTAIITERPV